MRISHIPTLRLIFDNVVIGNMFDLDENTLSVNVDGFKPFVLAARSIKNSDYTFIEFGRDIADIFSYFVDSVEQLLVLFGIIYFFGECYRRGVEIRLVKYLSAHGTGEGYGSATLSSG